MVLVEIIFGVDQRGLLRTAVVFSASPLVRTSFGVESRFQNGRLFGAAIFAWAIIEASFRPGLESFVITAVLAGNTGEVSLRGRSVGLSDAAVFGGTIIELQRAGRGTRAGTTVGSLGAAGYPCCVLRVFPTVVVIRSATSIGATAKLGRSYYVWAAGVSLESRETGLADGICTIVGAGGT